jgi:hypothetical protein
MLGDRYQRVKHMNNRLALLVARCSVVSHREELMQCLTHRHGQVRQVDSLRMGPGCPPKVIGINL